MNYFRHKPPHQHAACPLLLAAGIFSAFLIYGGDVVAATQSAAEGAIIAPVRAQLSPHGGHLAVKHHVDVKSDAGRNHVDFFIPANARNLEVNIKGQTIVRYSSIPAILERKSDYSARRMELEKQKINLEATLATLNARLAVWQTVPAEASGQELAHRQTMMQAEMPGLAEERAQTENQLRLVGRELAEMTWVEGPGQKIDVTLGSDVKKDQKLEIEYSYDLSSCGWETVYSFNASPGNKADDTVNVQLLAEVWQYSGADWTNTQITLATSGEGPREPRPLRRWVVGAEKPATPTAQPTPRSAATLKATARSADSGHDNVHPESAVAVMAANAPVPDVAPVEGDTEAVYASWTLSHPGLPEGKSRLQIAANAWQAPLQWLARPNTDNTNVWILAKYNLPPDQAWPAGRALYSVNNQNIGEGYFKPKGGEATLYFGADPRVTIHTSIDKNKQGETGFINTNKTWTGAWTYTIHNEHDDAIKVKVERPAPMAANDNITVTYDDKPKSQLDEKEHMVFWEVEVPAHGQTSIQHSVTIASPVQLPLLPDVP